ncbi:hypothetical protein Tco_1255243 [Tanacetum coccineum]
MNEKGIDSSKNEMVKEESKEKVKERSKEEGKKENEELRLHLNIAPDEEKEVDYEILDRKYPIKEWKTECLGTKPQVDKAEHLEEINQNVVIRSNDIKMRFSLTGFDRVLWGDLMIIFNPRVHTLMTEARLVIHMLIEKKYPLRMKVLLQMLELKLESEEDSTMALELIRFVKKQVAELEPEDSNGDEEDL